MTTRYYHTPPPPASTRVRCPVCHEEVYSRAGIHPQCAARQCDPPRPKGKAVVPIPTMPAGQATENVDEPNLEITSDSVLPTDGPR
jgi:hypothetical protein